MTVTRVSWTVDEYHQMIAAGILDSRRVELLRGEIVEMLPEGEPHAYFSSEADGTGCVAGSIWGLKCTKHTSHAWFI